MAGRRGESSPCDIDAIAKHSASTHPVVASLDLPSLPRAVKRAAA